jgi:hypothetical protein
MKIPGECQIGELPDFALYIGYFRFLIQECGIEKAGYILKTS